MGVVHRQAHAFHEWFSRQRARYSEGSHRPIAGYSAALATYGLGVAGAACVAKATHRQPPKLSAGDLALLTVATHKISRAIAKDPVTSPLRMPFTEYAGLSGPSELHEEVRAGGMQHAVGELVSCPFCLSPWVASGLLTGYTFAPGLTRPVLTAYTAVAGSDLLQFAYAAVQQRTVPPGQR